MGLLYLYLYLQSVCGRGSSVGLDGPGIESRWGEIFRRPDRP